jgi:formylglycine-generating enzyme required for sulfatase activity
MTARTFAILAVLFTAAALAQSTQPGSTKYPEMTLLPAGEYQMGDHYNFVDPQHPSDERPLHMVWIDSMYIGKYDVTNSQYVEFLNSAYAQGLIEVRSGLV